MTDAASGPRAEPRPPVLILCAGEVFAKDLVRELAGRRFQPLLSRPGWVWAAALEWARPVAVVVDSDDREALSDDFIAASRRADVGLVVFGDAMDSSPRPSAAHGIVRRGAARDVGLIGSAVDAVVRTRLA